MVLVVVVVGGGGGGGHYQTCLETARKMHGFEKCSVVLRIDFVELGRMKYLGTLRVREARGEWWWSVIRVDAPAPMRIASSTAKAILSAISVMGSRHWVVGVVEQGLHHVKIITRFCFVRCRAVPCIDMSVRLIALKPTRLMKIVMHCVGPNKYKQRLSTMCFMGRVWG
ncbi:hypothetical protein HZH68_009743 [Vespula germanica]|uniref:Uncharacterized protein n=1 Tax=Vespula germanica TaxID=30212 RepID=A0A834JW19_VESGE|nr:hypothetical protein HZH68_009743 [Vespula germanica]